MSTDSTPPAPQPVELASCGPGLRRAAAAHESDAVRALRLALSKKLLQERTYLESLEREDEE